MKKILFIAVVLLFSAHASAQLLTFGPQFTYNNTSVNSEGFSYDKSGTGMSYGGFLRVNVVLFYAQAELSYSQTEFSISRDGTSQTEYKMSGSDLALIAGFKVLPLGKIGNVRVFAGYDWKNFSKTETNNDLNHFDTESNNGSILIGAGVDIWKFTVDYRFLNGMTDVDRGPGEVKLNQSCISVGFKI